MAEELTIDTMRMVREIRDRMHEQAKDMTSEELIDFYNRRGTAVREQAMRELEEHSSTSPNGR